MLRRAWSTLIVVALAAVVLVPTAGAAMQDVTVTAASGADGAAASYALPEGWTTGSCTPPSGSHFPIGDSAVFCSGTQGVDPVFDAFQVHVLVADTSPPTIASGSDIAVEATTSAGAVVAYELPTVADDRAGVGAPVCAPASGSVFPVGRTVISCSVSDAAGNTTSKLFRTVTVVALAEPDVVNTVLPFRGKVGAITSPTRWALVRHGVHVPISCSASCSAVVSIQVVQRVKQGKRYATRYVRIGRSSSRFPYAGADQSLYATLDAGQSKRFTKARGAVTARIVVTIKRTNGRTPVTVIRSIKL